MDHLDGGSPRPAGQVNATESHEIPELLSFFPVLSFYPLTLWEYKGSSLSVSKLVKVKLEKSFHVLPRFHLPD